MRWFVSVFVICFIFVSSLLQFGISAQKISAKIKDPAKELEQTKEQIQELEKKKSELKKSEYSIKQSLQKIQKEIDASLKRQADLNKKILIAEALLKQYIQETQRYEQEKSYWENTWTKDFSQFYRQLIYPQNVAEKPAQHWIMRRSLQDKFSLMDQAEKNKNSSIAKTNRVERYKKNLFVLKEAAQKELEIEQRAQAEKNRLLKTTTGKRIAAEEEVSRLKETSKMLEKLIANLQKKRKTLGDTGLAQSQTWQEEKKGDFPWPLQGEIISKFGKQIHPELNIPVFNKGVRITGNSEDPVKSVAEGTVVFCDYFRSYGQTVIIDHGGDLYSVYGLLGNVTIKKNQKVKAGQTIAALPQKKPASLYFEVRHKGVADNPLLWLKR